MILQDQECLIQAQFAKPTSNAIQIKYTISNTSVTYVGDV